MADAAVELLLEKLKQLLVQHTHLIEGAANLVDKLEKHLLLFKAIPSDALKLRRNDETLKELIRQIRYAVYKTEDIIDNCVIRPNIVNIVHDLLKKIRAIYKENSRTKFHAEEESPIKETNVVLGLEKETEKLRGYLAEESKEVEVISIVGVAGLGKTILAGKIFHDPKIRSMFPTRIWVYASQEFTEKEIFLEILKEFTILTEDMKSKTSEALAYLVAGYLEKEKFLLVVDDIWTCQDWEKLRVALPKTTKMGKVLITSRFRDVGAYVCLGKYLHFMRFLNQKDSYSLLQLEAFRGQEFPPELEFEGRLISERCDGHPLAIVLIGGILVKQLSTDKDAMKTAWRKIWYGLDIIGNQDPVERLVRIIVLSYENLPYHLRECFLYFGMFPEDFEISVWKLIRLWIAEGFIQKKIGVSPEETAENYLEELIERKLVRAEKFKLDGKVKTCIIHDMIRDFCTSEARREGFSKQIVMSSDGGFQPPVYEELKFRRLCIHSNALDFFSRRSHGPSVRSFVCSSRDEMEMPKKDLSSISKGFKLLRVLDVEPINFTNKLPRNLFKLNHLKYVVLSFKLEVLPSAFSQLRNIETLLVDTSSRTLEVRADIFSMIQLRHFKTKASAALPKSSTDCVTAGAKIHTLGTLSPESCTKEVLDSVRDLKKLGIRGKIGLLLDGKNGSLDSMRKLYNLEKLKLLNDVFSIPASEIQLCSLPPPTKFPPYLKVLTLSRTSLDWCHMSVLGSLERLEVLKLKDKAFMGEVWEVTDGGFGRLKVLHIGRTNLKTWLASGHHFPVLRHLQLMHCQSLEQIPSELADVPSFLKLELFHCKQAAESAMEIQEKIELLGNVVGRFKLSILPHEE
ncbi:disease resistance protein RPP8-like [Salvia splendens]|uniref:disease resistance protein RPP8-like n=1 Tax=Salvia splendens TaxID=180675 RepID=UPI001C27C116|nr:disease resistance protein RPP8-like [Salvia splendens]